MELFPSPLCSDIMSDLPCSPADDHAWQHNGDLLLKRNSLTRTIWNAHYRRRKLKMSYRKLEIIIGKPHFLVTKLYGMVEDDIYILETLCGLI